MAEMEEYFCLVKFVQKCTLIIQTCLIPYRDAVYVQNFTNIFIHNQAMIMKYQHGDIN
jgi:hypothetical protein